MQTLVDIDQGKLNMIVVLKRLENTEGLGLLFGGDNSSVICKILKVFKGS